MPGDISIPTLPPAAPGPGVSRRRAFTLIELVVVLALIAILTVAILPEMRGSLDETVLRASGRTLIAACNTANARAISTGHPHRLTLDPGRNRCRIERAPDDRPPSATRSVPNQRSTAPDPGEAAPLDSRVTFEIQREEPPTPGIGPLEVEFRPDGTVDAVEFLLKDRSGFALAIRLNPVTGRPTVRELGRR